MKIFVFPSPKIRQNPCHDIIQSSSAFIRISWYILEVKRSALVNDWENITTYWEEPEQSEV